MKSSLRTLMALAVLLGVLRGTNVCLAEDAGAPDGTDTINAQLTNSASLQVNVGLEHVADLPPIHRAVINTSAGSFTFLVPRDYRVEGSSSGSMSLSALSQDRFLRLRLIEDAPSSTNQLQHAMFRHLVARQYPKALIVQESMRHAGGHSGPGFDLEWMIAAGVRQSARVIYVPCGRGILEVNLITNPARFEKASQDLNDVLLTFRAANPGGELAFDTLSSRF